MFQEPPAPAIHEEFGRTKGKRADRSTRAKSGSLPYTWTMPLDADAIDKLARLSALDLAADERAQVQIDLERIIELVDAIQAVDTAGVEPLAHPLDGVQPLRPDQVTETVDRDRYQRIAPAVRDGHYLVPRVVE